MVVNRHRHALGNVARSREGHVRPDLCHVPYPPFPKSLKDLSARESHSRCQVELRGCIQIPISLPHLNPGAAPTVIRNKRRRRTNRIGERPRPPTVPIDTDLKLSFESRSRLDYLHPIRITVVRWIIVRIGIDLSPLPFRNLIDPALARDVHYTQGAPHSRRFLRLIRIERASAEVIVPNLRSNNRKLTAIARGKHVVTRVIIPDKNRRAAIVSVPRSPRRDRRGNPA